jgi:ribosomal protein L11 methyltransferase
MRYPALDITAGDRDRVFFLLDDYAPTAIEDHGERLTAFFSDAARRDRARDGLARDMPDAVLSAREVDDEDWARRSQDNLAPVTVGRLTITPHSVHLPDLPDPPDLVIRPSMGFGTGHHATSRLCLKALQTIDLTGARVLDVGTGSGILALAARRLGARTAVGVDDDPDAIRSARENLELNRGLNGVEFEEGDARDWLMRPPRFAVDVVTANLTGALLQRIAPSLIAAARPDGGIIIVSGLLAEEGDGVRQAFSTVELGAELSEDEWLALIYRRYV